MVNMKDARSRNLLFLIFIAVQKPASNAVRIHVARKNERLYRFSRGSGDSRPAIFEKFRATSSQRRGMTTDCQGVNRFDRRADSLRRTGGPCLLPLADVSQRTWGVFQFVLTLGGRTTRMKRLRTLGPCGTSERAAQGHGL